MAEGRAGRSNMIFREAPPRLFLKNALRGKDDRTLKFDHTPSVLASVTVVVQRLPVYACRMNDGVPGKHSRNLTSPYRAAGGDRRRFCPPCCSASPISSCPASMRSPPGNAF